MLFQMSKNPFDDPNLVVRIKDQYYSWKAACPIIMSMALYERSFPNDITKEMGGCIWSSQKQEKHDSPVESGGNEPEKHSSWWPFSSKGNTDESTMPSIDSNTNPDQDIATAVATAFGATETDDQKVECNGSSNIKIVSLEEAVDLLQTPSSSDQVDNISQQSLNDNEIISSNITKDLISDSMIKAQENIASSIDIESNTTRGDCVAIDIENVTSGTQLNDSLPKTPPRTPRLDANVSSSSDVSHMDDILRKENISGKFRKTLRLSSDLIVSIYILLQKD